MEIIEIKNIILNELENYLNLKEISSDVNLLGLECEIFPHDMLYLIIRIEKQVGFMITDLFKSHDNNIMTINNLAKGIYELNDNNRLATPKNI